jgi:small ligand-binding sensory domain FIST
MASFDDMRFSVALSREPDGLNAAAHAVRTVRADLHERPADLACLFLSIDHADDAERIASFIRHEIGRPVLIGCTGEGVIGGSEEIESGPALALWAAALPGVSLLPVRLTPHADDGAVEGWPEASTGLERPVFLMMAEPFSAPMDDILAEAADRYPGARVIGGMAGGGRDLGENRLILNEDVYDRGAVAVALSGPIAIRTIVSQGCRPLGERYVVTKAENNVIYELSGVPALARLETMFKGLSADDRELAQRALHLGIVIDEHRNSFERGDFLVRNLIGADRTAASIAIGDLVSEGQTVQFHVRDADAASEDLRILIGRDRTGHRTRPKGALLFSCCGRGRGLFGTPNHDVTTVRSLAGVIPIAGFFAQGEIGPVGGSNFVHGYTASVAIFAERIDLTMEEEHEGSVGGRL